MNFQYKKDEEGKLVIGDNGHPVIVDESGTVVEVNVPQTFGKLRLMEKDLPDKNKEIKELKNSLAGWSQLKESFPDFCEAEKVTAALTELADLKTKTEGVDDRIQGLHNEYGTKLESLKKANQAELEERDSALSAAKMELAKARFLIPWAASKQLEGYKLPPNPDVLAMVLSTPVDGKSIKFNEDGTISGWNGEILTDYSTGEHIKDPEKALEMILTTHPLRDSIKLSDLPAGGGGMQFGGKSFGDWEKHFKPESRNITKQIELKNGNPELYNQLRDKYTVGEGHFRSVLEGN